MKRHLFVGYCWGSAGTTWLAKVLNAHPDILALHAPGAAGLDRGDQDSVLSMIDYTFEARDAGGAYSAVGFTHGIGVHMHEQLVECYGGRLRAFVLVRHPLTRARSQASLITNLRSRSDHQWHSMESEISESVEGLLELDPTLPTDPDSTAFYHACRALDRVVFEAKRELPFFKAEELFVDVRRVLDLVDHVSGGDLVGDRSTIELLQSGSIGAHADGPMDPDAIWASLPDHMKLAFSLSLSDEAAELYTNLGYELHAVPAV